MKQKSVGLTLRAFILALVLSLVAGSPALPPFDGVAYAQSSGLQASVAPDNSNVTLTWDAVTGADSYQIWRGEVVGGSAQWGTSAYDTVTAPAVTYTDDSVTAGATYAYGVRSVTGGTAASWMGPYPNVTIGGGTPAPTARPSVTVVAVGTTAVDVTWTSVSGATSYHIQFWHAALGNNWDRIPGDQTSPYSHTGLTTGTEYFYVVRAANAGGNGDWSNWRTDDSKITLQGTTAVPQLTLSRVDRTTVDISWTPTGAGAQYDLHRRKIHVASGTDETDGAWARLPSALLTDRSFRDSAANYVPTDAVSVKYEYKVRSVDSSGVEGQFSKAKSVSIPMAGAVLLAPTGLRASPISDSNIRVSWTNVPGAEFYELQWKSGDRSYSTSIRVDRPDSGNPFYDDTDLSSSTKYTYQVRAVDINGVGDWSTPASTSTRSTAAAAGQMPKVTGLSVADATSDNAADSRKAKLTWSAVSDATHYEIQRYDPSSTDGWKDLNNADGVTRITKAEAGSPPTHEDDFADGSAAGKAYFYVVSAVEDGVDGTVNNSDDEMGEWSDFKSVTFKAHKPGLPTAVAAVKTTGTSILVSWTAPGAGQETGSMAGAATSYTLRWRPGDSSTWRNIPVTGTSYHHTPLSGNTSYHYRVRAENSGGESDYVNLDTPVVLGNTLNRPTGLKAVDATDGTNVGIKVSWNAVSGASSYEVQRFAGTAWGGFDGTADDVEPAASGTMITDSDDNTLAAGMTYLYRVRTVKEAAKSGWSAPVSGTTKATAPGPPALVATSTGMSMIRLSWNAVAGATTYELEFLEGSYENNDLFGAPNLGRSKRTISGNHRNYVHTGRKSGTRYTYRLRAALAQGGETVWSTPAQQYTKPAKPVLSASSTISTTMVLKWDAVSFVGSDGSAGRLTTGTNYQIQRRLSGSGDWATVNSSAATTCSDNECEFSDTGADIVGATLSASETYYYRIRATVTTQDGGTYTSYWGYRNQSTSN